ncbi:SART-1 protein [Lipomyces japonicus]|uniref:SART-1 protein n=1 Tax=Lipomyces japonicus TaxID=56871 RepID=UPI0034CF5BBB
MFDKTSPHLIVNKTRAMSESSLSIKETNRLRASLGLKPIPVSEEPQTIQDESLSLAETNRRRISLGLKPIPITAEQTQISLDLPADDDLLVAANYVAHVSHQQQTFRQNAARARIKAAKERLERLKFLKGRGLGEGDEDSPEDAVAWLKKTKTKLRKSVISIPEEEGDDHEVNQEYSSNDLQGLKVAHDSTDILAGNELILTLKDSNVLDEEEDVLISTSIQDKERITKNRENRTKHAKYTGLEEDDDGKILGKYDDESQEKYFTIGTEDIVQPKNNKPELLVSPSTVVSLESSIAGADSDYMPSAPIKIKKPSKSKRMSSKKRTRVVSTVVPDNINEDDEYLQNLLSKQRRLAQIKRKRDISTPEDLANDIKYLPIDSESYKSNESGELIIDDTTDFVDLLRVEETNYMESSSLGEDAVKDALLEESKPLTDDQQDEPIVETEIKKATEYEESVHDATGLAETAAVQSIGIGDTLALLRNRGVIKEASSNEQERQRIQRTNLKWKAEMHKRKIQAELDLRRQREEDRRNGKYDGLTQKEREEAAARENQIRQIDAANEANKRFKNYKPDVKLEYKDEFGRAMTQKEAFKHLSHQFHGKGSGKAKTEKKLRRIEEERKKESGHIF